MRTPTLTQRRSLWIALALFLSSVFVFFVFVSLVVSLLGGKGCLFVKSKSAFNPTFTPDKFKPGERLEFDVQGVAFAFRYCPAGVFFMGSPKDESDRARINDETRHLVALTHGFWAQETETTRAQWKAVMGEYPPVDDARDDIPAIKISWLEFQTFVEKLNALNVAPDGYQFAMPTEAQWEYACRAGTTGARYGELDEIAATKEGVGPCPVGGKAPNAWGLYDTIGNVWEMTADIFGKYPRTPQIDPYNAKASNSFYINQYVLRGGDIINDSFGCRAASRIHVGPDRGGYTGGGRLVLVSID